MNRMKTLFAGMALSLPILFQEGKPFVIPVPQAEGPIPATAASHPLMAANINEPPIDLGARGYVEEE